MATKDRSGRVNVAPMGPVVDSDFQSFTLRPFAGSTTFQNLLETRCGVFHIVDRVDVIAAAAIKRLENIPPTESAKVIDGAVLLDCCRWYELKVVDIDTSDQRSVMGCEVVYTGEFRPFWGFNRARHAVLEAAILATRLHILDRTFVVDQLELFRSAVEKTGGVEEKEALQMLSDFCRDTYAEGLSA